MITLQEARRLLKEAVETQGRDFVYNPTRKAACLYRPATDTDVNTLGIAPREDAPSRRTACLIGVALDLAGETRHRQKGVKISQVRREFPDMMTEGVASYFQVAQDYQDRGDSWGAAYDSAEEFYLTVMKNRRSFYQGEDFDDQSEAGA